MFFGIYKMIPKSFRCGMKTCDFKLLAALNIAFIEEYEILSSAYLHIFVININNYLFEFDHQK